MVILETYIALLLLIVPGFIAHNIYEKLNNNRNIKDQFNLTVISLIYSIFIMLGNYLYISKIGLNGMTIDNITLMKSNLLNMKFLIQYIVLTLIVSILIAYIWNLVNPKLTYVIINIFRQVECKRKLYHHETVPESLFDDGKIHIVCILQNGEEKMGVLDRLRVSNESELEYSLIKEDEIRNLFISQSDHFIQKQTCRFKDITIIEYDDKIIVPNINRSKWKLFLFYGVIISVGILLCYIFR